MTLSEYSQVHSYDKSRQMFKLVCHQMFKLVWCQMFKLQGDQKRQSHVIFFWQI